MDYYEKYIYYKKNMYQLNKHLHKQQNKMGAVKQQNMRLLLYYLVQGRIHQEQLC